MPPDSRIIPPPKNVHTLILEICAHVVLHAERKFVDVIKDLEAGRAARIVQVGPMESQGKQEHQKQRGCNKK